MSLLQIMSVTQYWFEWLWNICNSRGCDYHCIFWYKKGLQPDYFLSAHKFRCSSFSSIMQLSKGRYTQLSRLAAIENLQSETWQFRVGRDCWLSWGKHFETNSYNNDKNEIWVSCFPGDIFVFHLYKKMKEKNSCPLWVHF